MLHLYSPKPNDGFFIHDPENGGEDSNIALEKLRDVIAQCILPQAGPLTYTRIWSINPPVSVPPKSVAGWSVGISLLAGENEDEKLNELMYEAWRINRDCKLLRDGLQGLSWDGRCLFISLHFIWKRAWKLVAGVGRSNGWCLRSLQEDLSVIKSTAWNWLK